MPTSVTRLPIHPPRPGTQSAATAPTGPAPAEAGPAALPFAPGSGDFTAASAGARHVFDHDLSLRITHAALGDMKPGSTQAAVLESMTLAFANAEEGSFHVIGSGLHFQFAHQEKERSRRFTCVCALAPDTHGVAAFSVDEHETGVPGIDRSRVRFKVELDRPRAHAGQAMRSPVPGAAGARVPHRFALMRGGLQQPQG